MALLTLGTNATDSLSALKFIYGAAPHDLGDLDNLIKNDLNPALPRVPGSISNGGMLFIPNRGFLQVLPGDYIGVDTTTGWPILLSAKAIASGPWTHS